MKRGGRRLTLEEILSDQFNPNLRCPDCGKLTLLKQKTPNQKAVVLTYYCDWCNEHFVSSEVYEEGKK